MAKRSNKKKKSPKIEPTERNESNQTVPATPARFDWILLLRAALIIVAGLWVYWPAFHGDWIWDDKWYIPGNPLFHNATGLWKFWFVPGSWVEYYPVEESVQWIQWQLWNSHTLGYHLTNVVLHLANALMVWRLLDKFGLRLAWLGGLLFALHPVQVESVAYMVELKNTLSLQPFLWAMCFWIDYEKHQGRRDYWCALALFFVAMLCKISMAPFPVVILLYAWWKRGRIGCGDVLASAPFFVIALALGLTTLQAGTWYRPVQHQLPSELIAPLGGFFSRVACAGLSLSFYLWKFFWPVGLLPIYPQWLINPPSPLQFLPWPILGIIFYICWRRRTQEGRHLLLGLGFFLLMLAPFLGFTEVSYMSFTWVMDHLLYLPIIGLIGLVVAGLDMAEARLPRPLRLCGIGIIAVIFALLAYCSHLYAGVFVDEKTLWNYTIEHNPNAWLAHNDLGVDLKQEGHLQEAIAQYKLALQVKPEYASAYNNLGAALQAAGSSALAQQQYEKALQLYPDYPDAHNNLANLLTGENKFAEAQAHYEEALRISPTFALAHNNLGTLFMQLGETPRAIEQYQAALQTDPDYADVHFNLGNAFQQQARYPEAKEQYEIALKLNPVFLEAYNNLGAALNNMGQSDEAMAQLNAVLKLNPRYADAHNNLGAVYFQKGQLAAAVAEFEKALQLKPDDADAKKNLAKAQAMVLRQMAPK